VWLVVGMSQPEDWELQLAPLVNTSDLLSVFEPENGVLAGVTLKASHSSVQPKASRAANEAATVSASEAVYHNAATSKITKERVEILSYPMNGVGARKCLREAVMLKRPSLCGESPSPAVRRGLQHIISPLGIWTTAKTSFLHVRAILDSWACPIGSRFAFWRQNPGLPSFPLPPPCLPTFLLALTNTFADPIAPPSFPSLFLCAAGPEQSWHSHIGEVSRYDISGSPPSPSSAKSCLLRLFRLRSFSIVWSR